MGSRRSAHEDNVGPMQNRQLTYQVIWSDTEGGFVGLCAEYPSLSWLASTKDEAIAGIRDLVAVCVADMEANGIPINPVTI